MPSKISILLFTGLYALIRLFSWYFPPSSLVNSIFSVFVILTVIFLFITKREMYAWAAVAGEIILGGSGSFFQFHGIALRSLLLVASVFTWFFIHPGEIKNSLKIWPIILLFAAAVFSAVRGWYFSHPLHFILADFIPYAFLLYYFPLKNLIVNETFKKIMISLIFAALIGEGLFFLITITGFSTHLFSLQDQYYHWFRDIAGGKITPVESNYYRLVLNEQLLLAPIMVYLLSGIINKKKNYYFYLIICLFILALNLTRIYLIGLLISSIVLVSRINWQRAIKTYVLTALGFLVIYSGMFLIISGGKSFGLEVFGLRLQSIGAPQMEESSLSRLILLPKIVGVIEAHPFFGVGLGSTLTVFSPVLNTIITTTQYDWGYFEIIAELGLIGATIWSIFLIGILLKQKNQRHGAPLASFAALLVINATSPALFHVLGIIFLVFLMALADASSKQSLSPLHSP